MFAPTPNPQAWERSFEDTVFGKLISVAANSTQADGRVGTSWVWEWRDVTPFERMPNPQTRLELKVDVGQGFRWGKDPGGEEAKGDEQELERPVELQLQAVLHAIGETHDPHDKNQ